jgi:hypothetical protein
VFGVGRDASTKGRQTRQAPSRRARNGSRLASVVAYFPVLTCRNPPCRFAALSCGLRPKLHPSVHFDSSARIFPEVRCPLQLTGFAWTSTTASEPCAAPLASPRRVTLHLIRSRVLAGSYQELFSPLPMHETHADIYIRRAEFVALVVVNRYAVINLKQIGGY